MKTLLKILGWVIVPFIMIFIQWKRLNVAVKVIGIIWAVIILSGVISSIVNPPTAAEKAATQKAIDNIKVPVAPTKAVTQTVPAATATSVAATPAPIADHSQLLTKAEIDAANKATAQLKLDMLTTDIASDIRSEDKNQAFLDNVYQQGKLQQAYQSAQDLSNKIDLGQKMYQTIANELEDSPIKAKLKDIAINAKINLQGYQNGYKDYMKFLDSVKQSDLYNAQQNFAVAKASMQDLETQLVKMGGHDQP